LTRFDVWRRRSTIQMGCPAFVPGFLLCGHSHPFITILPATCWQRHNRSNPEAAEGLTVRAFADEIQRQIRAFKEELNALKVASNQSRAISLESAFGLAWMRTMQ